jgi:predicted MFS family arabinose efflux permease
MLASQIGMLATASGLAALTWAGLISPGLLLAFTFSIGIGTALNSPAWQASVRQQVPKAELPQAIALNSISFNIARSVGPALGGLLISVWDIWLAFAINAISYFGLIFVLLWWRPEPRKVRVMPMFKAIGVGLRFCATTVSIRRLLMRGLVLGAGIAGYQALLPAVVSDRLGGDEFDFGLLLGVFGVGSIVAAPFIGTIRRRIRLEGILALGAGLFIAVMTVMAEVHSVTFAVPAVFLGGMAWVAVLTSLNMAIQMRSPDEILGRCLSIYQAVTFGGMAVGSYLWGLVADVTSLPFALHSASIFIVLAFLALHRFAPLPQAQGDSIRQP